MSIWKGIRPWWTVLTLLAATLSLTSIVTAQEYTAPSNPQLGSGNTVTADASVPRPGGTPCVVPLFTDYTFANFSPKTFAYTPPADCPGPWAKVVLTADFSINAGRQYDRTANIWIGGTNVYFGTTAEPSATVARSWHIESDLTDYSALFTSAQPGRVDLGNLVNSTYTGILHGSAELEFYRAQPGRAPITPDVVLPLSAGPTGGTVALSTTSSKLARTFTFPTNVIRAYLDVTAQSQSGDEFWYSCVPNDVAGELQNCGSTGFRETEVTIDGQPAGVAPVYPWIYTGGVDPFLWRPIPGVQTLNFKPYRVDLTPFAGVLNDGKQHEVAISVYNANHYFSTTGTLLLYRDPLKKKVKGALTEDTLAAAPIPVITENLTNNGGVITGPVSIKAERQYGIAGYVFTSSGRVETQVTQNIDFSNYQFETVSDSVYAQDIKQDTTIQSLTTTKLPGQVRLSYRHLYWPLVLNYNFTVNPDGSATQTAEVQQAYREGKVVTVNGTPIFSKTLSDEVSPADTLIFHADGSISNEGQSSSERYQYKDSNGRCWDRTITAADGVLTSVNGGQCSQ